MISVFEILVLQRFILSFNCIVVVCAEYKSVLPECPHPLLYNRKEKRQCSRHFAKPSPKKDLHRNF